MVSGVGEEVVSGVGEEVVSGAGEEVVSEAGEEVVSGIGEEVVSAVDERTVETSIVEDSVIEVSVSLEGPVAFTDDEVVNTLVINVSDVVGEMSLSKDIEVVTSIIVLELGLKEGTVVKEPKVDVGLTLDAEVDLKVGLEVLSWMPV